MFDFEKLEVYKIAHQQNLKVAEWVSSMHIADIKIIEIFTSANLEIVLNLTEGSSHIESQRKQHYYIKSRSAVFNAVTILLLLRDKKEVDEEKFQELYNGYESLSRMLLTLVRNLSNNIHHKPFHQTVKKKDDFAINIDTFGE